MISRYCSPKHNVSEISMNYQYVRVYFEIGNELCREEVLSFDEMYFDGYKDDGVTYTGSSYPDVNIDGNISIDVKNLKILIKIKNIMLILQPIHCNTDLVMKRKRKRTEKKDKYYSGCDNYNDLSSLQCGVAIL